MPRSREIKICKICKVLYASKRHEGMCFICSRIKHCEKNKYNKFRLEPIPEEIPEEKIVEKK